MRIKCIRFYANLKHSKRVRTDCVLILDRENLSHLIQNSFALYVCCRSNSGYKASLLFLSLFPDTRFSASVPPPLPQPARVPRAGHPGTDGDHGPPPEQQFVPTICILHLISPATPAAPHLFQPCPHLSRLHARRTLEGPDRILLIPLC